MDVKRDTVTLNSNKYSTCGQHSVILLISRIETDNGDGLKQLNRESVPQSSEYNTHSFFT